MLSFPPVSPGFVRILAAGAVTTRARDVALRARSMSALESGGATGNGANLCSTAPGSGALAAEFELALLRAPKAGGALATGSRVRSTRAHSNATTAAIENAANVRDTVGFDQNPSGSTGSGDAACGFSSNGG